MRFESRTWFLLSLALFIAAIYFWKRGNEYQRRKNKSVVPVQEQVATNRPSAFRASPAKPFPLLSANTQAQPNQTPVAQVAPAPQVAVLPAKDTNFPFRLSNTARKIAELSRVETAVLMRNAFIDTAEAGRLAIPEHLKAVGDPGTYIVQARGPIRAGFRERLRQAGASIVSYIPNNAYLVQVSGEKANWLAGLPDTQAVLPFEPYYKLDTTLLPMAVEQKPLADDQWLRVTVFTGAGQAAATAIAGLGGQVIHEEQGPFGTQLLIKPDPNSLASIAQLASVQTIEVQRRREFMTDIARVIIGQTTNGSTAVNYLNLTGTNVLINVNDSGVDSTNPDLVGRVFADTPSALTDPVAHGTHVAGIIAGNGSRSSTVTKTPVGSETNANFRGIAPGAQLFVLHSQAFPEVNRFMDDTYLFETAARTNATATYARRRAGPMISNNSWAYVSANEYDTSAARFDAAVRDAIPDGRNNSGTQPMIFVFAAGNSGNGTDAGEGGEANSIPSPGTAKNVITVGALEQPRFITNSVVVTNVDGSFSTNAIFFDVTDSANQVAAFSSRGNVGIGTEGEFGRYKPDVVAPGTFLIATRSKDFDLANQFETNSDPYKIISELNEPLAPTYRVETGTSQAAPVVSGMLALMQELFEQRIIGAARRTNSPALMKALLINGARSAGPLYDLQVQSSVNYQGWGRVSLTNSLPPALLNQPESAWPTRFFDQVRTNALATGDSRSWSVNLSTNAQVSPFRVTLVWTDPPGNPTAAIKLVNDLDLVVSNTVTHEVFYGNDIREGSDFNHPSLEEPAVSDLINNVENVFIREAATSNFVVTVTAKRVNVAAVSDYNQVTRNNLDVVQDYALVIACGDSTITNAFTSITPVAPPPPAEVTVTSMTNGVPLLNERVGANAPLSNLRNGITNQWNFYVFTNTFVTNELSSLTNGTNVAFITFLPPNVARSRIDSADIDLYVSRDPSLVDLNPAAVNAAFKSVTRFGTELVVFTNAALDEVFYIGVKSEDQQSGEYGLIALSTDTPFDEDRDGARVLHGLPVPQGIPDGTPAEPGRATVFAIGIAAVTVERVTVTNVLTHQDVGDLSIVLDHDQTSVFLHNHTLNGGLSTVTNELFVYNDQVGPRFSDGPGSLNDFAGEQANGVWMMNFIDNTPNRTGRVENVTLRIEPFRAADLGAAGDEGIRGTVPGNSTVCYFIDVPPEATNLVLTLSELTGRLEMYVALESLPTTNSYQKSGVFDAPGGVLMWGANDEPIPLGAGRCFVCLRNPGSTPVDFRLQARLQLGTGLDFRRDIGTNGIPLIDDGIIRSTVNLPVDKQVADLQVSVRIDHPRSSDLVLHLISPQGTRLLLAENRGGPNLQGYGTGSAAESNLTYTVFTEDTNLVKDLAPIKFSLPPWSTNSNGATSPPTFFDSFESAVPGTYNTNESFTAWTVISGKVNVHGPNNPLGIVARDGTNFVELDTTASPGGILTTINTTPGKQYELTFFYHRNPSSGHGALSVYYGPPATNRTGMKFIDVPTLAWQSTNIVFTANSPTTQLEFRSLTSAGPLLDAIALGDVVVHTNIYLLPEEPLSLLKGERAQGDWTLEVWDNRRGPQGGPPGTLIDWKVQIEYGNPPGRATVLTNGFNLTDVVEGDRTNYYVVNVCETSRNGFAALTGPFDLLFNDARMQLIIDRDGYPTGDFETDDYAPIPNNQSIDESAETGVAAITFTSDPRQPAPLRPGKPLFFGVHNLFPGETNTFDLRVLFDNDTCSTVRPVIRLTNDIPYTNILAPSGIVLDYYVFNVSPIAVEAEFEVTPRNGDVGMVLRYGLPLPDLTRFDYRSDLPGITNELIVLTNGSAPVNLSSGDWYIGVYNNTTNAVRYDVRASQILDTNINLITLTNGISRDFTLQQGAGLTNFFLLEVPEPYPGLKFELFNLSGNADLLIGFNFLPYPTNALPTNYFLSNSASPSAPLVGDTAVLVMTNTTDLPDLRGNWLLAVINTNLTNLDFTIRGTFITGLETNQPPPGTNVVIDPDITITDTNICFSWPTTPGLQYQLEGKRSLTETNWSLIYGPVTATNTVLNYCITRPSEFAFFRVIQLGGGEQPPPTGNIINPSVQVKTNEICLTWASQVGLSYFVQGKTSIVDEAWANIAGPIVATDTNTTYCVPRPTPYQFFQILESGTNQPPPTGEPINPVVQVKTNEICLTWASTIGSNYFVQGKTSIVDTAWANLAGPITATDTNTTYCVPRPTPYQFFQIIESGGTNQPPPTGEPINPVVQVKTNEICLTWASTIGSNYFVQGKTSIVDTAWANLAGPITATDTNTTYCVPRPTPYQFFQIIESGETNQPPLTGANSSIRPCR
ncbi:MAG: S8 family serine peptidase [Verrucomicrobiota bacterium]